MEGERLAVLLIEDDPGDAGSVQGLLARDGSFGHEIDHATRLDMALGKLKEKRYDMVLLDPGLPDSTGLDSLDKVIRAAKDAPIIVLIEQGDEMVAAKALKEGAQDYLVKGHFDDRLLARAIKSSIGSRKAEVHIKHLNRILQAIRSVNQLITQEKDKSRLLEGACSILFETRRYRHIYVLLLDEEGRVVQSSEAHEAEGLKDIAFGGDLPLCVARALGSEDITIVEDPDRECQGCVVREGCDGRIVISKLTSVDRTYGVLVIWAPPELAIGAEELGLLKEVSGDIAHALYVLDMEKDRERHFQEIYISKEKLRAIFESSTGAMTVLDVYGNIIDTNPAAVRLFGYPSTGEMTRKKLWDMFQEEGFGRVKDLFDMAFEGRPMTGIELEMKREDGEVFTGSVSMSKIEEPTGYWSHVVMTSEDLTLRKEAERYERARAKDEIIGFVTSALPVFASSIPTQARDSLIKSFGERFEQRMRPRFMKFLECDIAKSKGNGADVIDTAPMNRTSIKWIAELFENLGNKVNVQVEDPCPSIELLECPWSDGRGSNPIFCLLCRTMVIRSVSWIDGGGHVVQRSSMASGADSCRFIFTISGKKGICTSTNR